MKKHILFLSALLFVLPLANISAQQLDGIVFDEQARPLSGANVLIGKINKGTLSDHDGRFHIDNLSPGAYQVQVSFVGYKTVEKNVRIDDGTTKVRFTLPVDDKLLLEVEVFGERYRQPEKMEIITRMPLRPSEQLQSISVISHKMITEQGAQTLNDAVRNAPGLSTFATYGNTSESITSRGYRGIPVLKNGVRVQSDFRGVGFLTDMQGVETIQILKGSAAMSQGLGNDLGSGGGVINIATKTPRFIDAGEIGLYLGSWGKVRPTFDVQRTFGSSDNVAFRLNGAIGRSDNYRKYVTGDRIYINPSLAWRPDEKTDVVVEMDYLHDSRTPDQGTVNLSADSVKNIYKMPNDRLLGFRNDRNFMNNMTYAARLNRNLGDGFSLRFAYFGSHLDTKSIRGHASALKNVSKTGEYNKRARSLSSSSRQDDNSVFQVDFIGKDIYSGNVKHTFQTGFDYKKSYVKTISSNSIVIDTIDVLHPFTNTYSLKSGQKLTDNDPVETSEYVYGFVAQDVITFNKFLKLSLGIHYGFVNGVSGNSVATIDGGAWDPLVGIIITPFGDFNLFASYTSTTSLRGAADILDSDKTSTVGPTKEKQFEAGIKSEWFNHRLHFNTTFFHILNDNLTYQALNDAGQSTGYYIKAGNLRRVGAEAELTGRLLTNMDVVLGYAYLDAQYRDSQYYHEGSAPMNTAKHTANGWLNYVVDKGPLKNLSFGLGAYYVGKRPLAEYTYKVLPGHAVQPNTRPFLADAYTTVNLQMGYAAGNWHLRAFLNNVFDSTGYTAYYRGGYLNPTDPRNVAASITYGF